MTRTTDQASPTLTIRPATAADAFQIRVLIGELAHYERELDQVSITEADIARDGFGADPQFRALIADWDLEPVGFAIFFDYYSTWRGRGLYLEDLFIRPAYRRRGIGTQLLSQVAREAEREDRLFVRWSVLHWNEGAMDFYKTLGAGLLDDWRTVALAGDSLKRLAAKSG